MQLKRPLNSCFLLRPFLILSTKVPVNMPAEKSTQTTKEQKLKDESVSGRPCARLLSISSAFAAAITIELTGYIDKYLKNT